MQNFRTNGSAVAEKNGNIHYIHTYIEKYNIGLAVKYSTVDVRALG